MQIGRRTVMAVGTFVLAAATGHVMQHSGAIAARLRDAGILTAPGTLVQASLTSASTTSAGSIAPVLPTDATTLAEAVSHALPDIPDLPALSPAAFTDTTTLAQRLNNPALGTPRPPSMADRDYDLYGRLCAEPTLTLTHLKPALLGLSLTAACRAHERVQITHAGLSFAAMTDDQGHFATTIPALATKGEVTVHLQHGPDLSAQRIVPDLGSVSRFAVAMRGQSGLHLSAHVQSADQDRQLGATDPGLPTLGLGGFLTVLGDASLDRPMVADIITTPADLPHGKLEILADVTADSCGRDLLGTTFRIERAVVPTPGAVSFAMPGCDAIGTRLAMDVDATEMALASAQR